MRVNRPELSAPAPLHRDSPVLGAKAKAAMTQAQYTMEELRRGVLAKAASDPGILAAKQKVDAAKVQLADASKQLQEARKLQARTDEKQLDDEIQRKQNAIVDPTRRR